MKTPIIITAFGTTTKALETYSFIHNILEQRFPEHKILWAYSSRMVKDWIKKRKNIEFKHPHQVLLELKEKGYTWAAVQSLHLICGHEFYRLVDEVNQCEVRTSIGLPLLSAPEDYESLVKTFAEKNSQRDEAVVMIGHGTDHPSWSSYLALQCIFDEKYNNSLYMGVVEHGYPSRENVVERVKQAGFKRVKLFPFMLVAGVHFEEDIMGDEDSWKNAFEEQGISVSAQSKGFGFDEGIVDIFCRHIHDALDVIPGNVQG